MNTLINDDVTKSLQQCKDICEIENALQKMGNLAQVKTQWSRLLQYYLGLLDYSHIPDLKTNIKPLEFYYQIETLFTDLLSGTKTDFVFDDLYRHNLLDDFHENLETLFLGYFSSIAANDFVEATEAREFFMLYSRLNAFLGLVKTELDKRPTKELATV
jgi:hypothetical protein